MKRAARQWASLLSVVLLAGGCVSDVYACEDDASCPGGACEGNGYCSFPDDACPTGRRYGEFSGPFSGKCVDAEGDGATSTSGTAEGSGAGTTSASGSSSASPPTSDTNGTGLPDTCGDGVCVAPPPNGWSGPISVRDAALEDACAADEGAQAFMAFPSFSGDWECECECDLIIKGQGCDEEALLQVFDEDDCRGEPVNSAELGPLCEDLSFDDAYYRAVGIPADASCFPDTVFEADSVQGVDGVLGCELPVGEPCGDAGTCVAESASGAVCIWAEGDQDCPGEGYTNRTVYHQSVSDSRDCEPCGCSVQGGCAGEVTLYVGESGCGDAMPPTVVVPFGTCTAESHTVTGVEASVDGVDTIECVKSGGDRVGGLLPQDSVTVCCG